MVTNVRGRGGALVMIAFPSKVTVTVEVAEVYCQLTTIVSCSSPANTGDSQR